jgi:signal transduction histidine kinase
MLILAVAIAFVASAQNSNIDSLKNILPGTQGIDRGKTLLELCWQYRFASADTARQYGFEALDIARKMDNKELEVEALHNIGVTYEAQGDYKDALQYEIQALALRETLGDSIKLANTLNNLGIIYDEQGDFKDALEHYFHARKIYERAGDQEKIAMVSLNIGVVLKAQEDYAEAARYYRNAMEIYKDIKKPFGVAACYANLGSVYFYVPQYDSSLYFSLLATKEFEQQKILQFLPTTLCNAGMAYDKLGMKKESKEYLIRAQEMNAQYDNKKELSFVMIYLAGVYRQEGNYALATKTVNDAIEIARRINARQQVMEGLKEYSEICFALGNYKQAFIEFGKHSVVKDSLFKDEKTKQIAELQTKYETEKKEGEILQLRHENELKDSRDQRNKLMIAGLGGLVVMLIVMGYLVRNRLVFKQKAELEKTKTLLREAQLAAVITSQEDERKRFAADLHDGLGQLISAVRLNLSKENVEKRSVDQAVEVLNEMNSEIRNIAFNLMPQVLIRSGLMEALQELAARINRTERIRINIGSFDLVPIHETDKKVALYRICQEWINNVLKYSNCNNIIVQLVQHQQEVVVTIEDDGTGFDTSKLIHSVGNGWKNINSRLAMIHGQIDIDSLPGRPGTTLIVTVPGLAAMAA